MAKTERFKRIDGYSGYMVSTLGVVRDSSTLRELRQHETWHGTQRVRIRDDRDRWRQVPVCKLVAAAFVENPDDFEGIVYVDGDKRNCAADNLRWSQARGATYVTSSRTNPWGLGRYELARIKDGFANGRTIEALAKAYEIDVGMVDAICHPEKRPPSGACITGKVLPPWTSK